MRGESEPSPTKKDVESESSPTKRGVESEPSPTKKDDAKSVTSSKVSKASVSSSIKLREAKIKQELVQRKREQALKEQMLKREQLELQHKIENMRIDNEIENANVEAHMWQQEVDLQRDDQISLDNEEAIDVAKRTEEWCQQSSAQVMGRGTEPTGHPLDKQVPLLDMISTSLNLSKPEIQTFSGDPINYWSFMSSYDVNIAQRSFDDRVKLSYLIQFCSGKARDAIKNCVLLDPATGYKQARDIVYSQFGRTYIVARAHIKQVLNRTNLRSGDSQGLWDLARDMRRCQMTLTQMRFTADMSATDNLLKIQELLPVRLQSKWATTAHTLMENQVMPNFSHMTNFVEEQAKIASNVYGSHVGKPQKNSKPNIPNRKPKESRASTFSTQCTSKSDTLVSDRCYFCSKDHSIEECEAFKKKSVVERFEFVKGKGLCFNCLHKSHTARGCRVESKCSKDQCNRKHHTLLHSERRQTGSGDRQNGAGRRALFNKTNPIKRELYMQTRVKWRWKGIKGCACECSQSRLNMKGVKFQHGHS
ncbi:hypothetical protein HOLleu_07665 [Holothuria leucospilota]|uniref:Uncharacterized protein n=1 Tax=Holothuria leucospilota TaxID=206669 RepID=A0A9Q1CG97_HOLLE|nr:hypothetical protein HOLleu_07665 [Holothuria leucospilota]